MGQLESHLSRDDVLDGKIEGMGQPMLSVACK